MGKGKWLMSLFTIILVAAGAFMPFGVSFLQDNRMESKKDYRELPGVHLTLREKNMTTAQSLALFSNGYTRIKWEGMTQLTEQKAKEGAKEAVSLMAQKGLLSQEAIEESDGISQTFLVGSGLEGSESAVLWECSWTGRDDNVYIVTINDAEGKMVQFRVIISSSSTVAIAEDEDSFVYKSREDSQYDGNLAQEWADFFKAYYGFESVQIQWLLEEGTDMQLIFSLPEEPSNEDSKQVIIKIPFDLNEKGIKFNR